MQPGVPLETGDHGVTGAHRHAEVLILRVDEQAGVRKQQGLAVERVRVYDASVRSTVHSNGSRLLRIVEQLTEVQMRGAPLRPSVARPDRCRPVMHVNVRSDGSPVPVTNQSPNGSAATPHGVEFVEDPTKKRLVIVRRESYVSDCLRSDGQQLLDTERF